ncbi:hypothetical protein ABL144_005316 [Klebsiella pneumoniae]
MNSITIEEKDLNSGVFVINQAKFKNKTAYTCIRMTDDIKSLLKQKCSGALDIAIIGLLNHGLSKLKEQNKAIEIKNIDGNIHFIEHDKTTGNSYINVKAKIQRESSKSFSIRMDKDLKERLKEASGNISYSVGILGVIKYSLFMLEKNNKAIIIKNTDANIDNSYFI